MDLYFIFFEQCSLTFAKKSYLTTITEFYYCYDFNVNLDSGYLQGVLHKQPSTDSINDILASNATLVS